MLTRSFLLLICSCSILNAAHVPNSCIAKVQPEANHVIRFCTTRSLTDGALKNSLLLQLKHAFKIKVFVETGTYLGQTTLEAAKLFKQVHTIELSEELCNKAKNRLKEWGNTSVHQGSSDELLKQLLPSISQRILFYLDGHYSGGITAKGVQNTPVLEELVAIKNAGKSDSVILIDDIRLFQDLAFPEKIKKFTSRLSDISQIITALLQINPRYQSICFKRCSAGFSGRCLCERFTSC